jgi:opacity protein-like surface antigen
MNFIMKPIFAALLILVSFLSYSQAIEKTETKINSSADLSIFVGGSQALGAYGSAEINDEEAGYAESGSVWGLRLNLRLVEQLKLVFEYSQSNHSFRDQNFTEDLRVLTGQPFSATAENYRISFAGVGVKFVVGQNKIKAYLNPMFGRTTMIFPEITTRSGSITRTIAESEETMFSYKLNAGVDVTLSPRITLGFNVAYLNLGIVETNSSGTTQQGGQSISQPVELKIPTSILNSSLSLGYRF